MGNSRKVLELRSLVFFYNPIDFLISLKFVLSLEGWLYDKVNVNISRSVNGWLINFSHVLLLLEGKMWWQFLNFHWDLIIDRMIWFFFDLFI